MQTMLAHKPRMNDKKTYAVSRCKEVAGSNNDVEEIVVAPK